MPRTTGLTSAAAALRYYERRQEIAANNLANVSTDGFKGEKAFARMLGDATPTVQAATDLRAGTLRETRNPLDVALGSADGFLVVATPTGERFTRGGALRLDQDRQLVDAAGHAVLGERGPVVLPAGAQVALGADGTLSVDGRPVDRLRVERQAPGAQLAHEGGTLFVPDAGRQPVAPAERQLRQGFVEESNVGTIGALVDMIAVQRAYGSVQKAITTLDAVRGTAATDLGRPV